MQTGAVLHRQHLASLQGQGREWKDGHSFGAKDLENLEKVIKAARPVLKIPKATADSLDA